MNQETFVSKLFSISDQASFASLAIEMFHEQYQQTAIYRRYCELIGVDASRVNRLDQIPFLPVSFFTSHKVINETMQPQLVFESSGTTGSQKSHHFVADELLYNKSFSEGFRLFYGHPGDYCLLALLPSYLERKGSSLVHMVDGLMKQSGHPLNGFYLHDKDALTARLIELREARQKTMLIGVTYALLDLAEAFPMQFPDLIVMETGGMKGRRREMVRDEVHEVLCNRFGISRVHSEYGMTELLSQAYSSGGGLFKTPPWMKIFIRDMNDPLSMAAPGQSGGINVIDLANRHSCAFIATQDVGRLHAGDSFEVIGRFDHSEVRGCNLMVG